MPIVVHQKPKREQQKSRSSLLENILVRLGIGVMVGLVGFFIGFSLAARTPIGEEVGSKTHPNGLTLCAIGGAVIGFLIGFVLGDNISEDWFSNIFGPRNW